MKPITPKEVTQEKIKAIPDRVVEIFNRVITRYWNGTSSTFRQSEVLAMICNETGEHMADVFREGWLDIEDIYESAGWDVEYDKPGFNENYPATFTFRKKESK